MRHLQIVAASLMLLWTAAAGAADWGQVDAVLGRPGVTTGETRRYNFPRTDLHVTVDGVEIKPTFALGGWATFAPMHGGAMMMGDLVLLGSEVPRAMGKLLDAGLEVTALHHHLLRAEPPVFFMHIGGHGDPVKLAAGVRAALAESGALTAPPPVAGAALDLDTAALDRAMGAPGFATPHAYQFAVMRRDPIVEHGLEVTAPLGGANVIAFQPVGAGRAAVTGDFVLTAGEVVPLTRTLRRLGIEITAIHSHMLSEQPRLYFVHFWAVDDAPTLAAKLREALNQTAVTR